MRLSFDDAYLEDLKDEIIHAQQLAVDEDNRALCGLERKNQPQRRPRLRRGRTKRQRMVSSS